MHPVRLPAVLVGLFVVLAAPAWSCDKPNPDDCKDAPAAASSMPGKTGSYRASTAKNTVEPVPKKGDGSTLIGDEIGDGLSGNGGCNGCANDDGIVKSAPTTGDQGKIIMGAGGSGSGNALAGALSGGVVPHSLGDPIKAGNGTAVVPSAATTPTDPNALAQRGAGLPTTVSNLAQSGDGAGALAAAKTALQNDPNNKDLQAFVAAHDRSQTIGATVKSRAAALIASLRGDAGDAPPPGAALQQASILPFASAGPAGAPGARVLTPTQAATLAAGMTAAERAAAGAILRQASNRIQLRDYPSADEILSRRLGENPSDEPALRMRAYERRLARRTFESAQDAKGAFALAAWDTRARNTYVEDLVDIGRPADALAAADEGLLSYPHDAHLLAARGYAYDALGQRAQALADYKAAAEADAVYDGLYKEELARGTAAAVRSGLPRPNLVWLGAIGTALLFFSFALFRKRGETSMRVAMRSDDRAALDRGPRGDAAPAGFKILRTLGQGGMGVVYEALDLGLQRAVALKKLRAEVADSPRERSRFLKEARVVAGLKHPNIVEIHAIHEDAEGLFLVFEKVGGETLHERLGRGALAPAEAVALLRQVAQALDHAHASGVVHQDLKPANVMVDGDRAKVMDFGIARRVAETMSTLSRVEVAGTPAYMAPEQERGGGVGPAADIFALGACAYELLAGRTPFPSGGLMMKAEKMYRPLSEVRPGTPAAADAVVARALEPDPSARWPTASSFVEALARSFAAS